MAKLDISPATWDNAAALAAERIDLCIAKGIEHPYADDREQLLCDLRDGFDAFKIMMFGTDEWEFGEKHRHVTVEFLIAFAVIVLALVPHYDMVLSSKMKKAEDVLPLLRRKQEDYGYNNISAFGIDGILVRMHDKIARIENLTDKQVEGLNEPLTDSFYDLIGYCIIGIMVALGIWELPLRPHPQDSPAESWHA